MHRSIRRALGPCSWLALVCTALLVHTTASAGGHNRPARKVEPVVFDAALRSEETGTVLVSGANRGIGLAMVSNYLDRGWDVIATARKPEAATELAELLQTYPDALRIERMDLLDLESIDTLAESLRDVPIDVLLNNAALMGEPNDQVLGAYDYELMKRVFNVNAVGTLKMVEALLPNVEASTQKKIVGISSTQGSCASQALCFTR
jgi:NAD(P)-dependent dehydrogenase (short-subunit alcohol dehydrogenase family)